MTDPKIDALIEQGHQQTWLIRLVMTEVMALEAQRREHRRKLRQARRMRIYMAWVAIVITLMAACLGGWLIMR